MNFSGLLLHSKPKEFTLLSKICTTVKRIDYSSSFEFETNKKFRSHFILRSNSRY